MKEFYSPNFVGELTLRQAAKMRQALIGAIKADGDRDIEKRVSGISRIKGYCYGELVHEYTEFLRKSREPA